ncbi:MAG TPA: pilin [Candidatus Methylomirabilis sp.]|nr:pilin [Candidatus Methylomirabilis sp.]
MKFFAWLKYFFIYAAVLLSSATNARAANLQNAFQVTDKSNKDILDTAANRAGYNTGTTDINTIVGAIIQGLLSLLGVIFLGLIIYGGVIWMTAEGDEQKVEKAQRILRNSVIGLIIVIAAYAISYFVVSALTRQAMP